MTRSSEGTAKIRDASLFKNDLLDSNDSCGWSGGHSQSQVLLDVSLIIYITVIMQDLVLCGNN